MNLKKFATLIQSAPAKPEPQPKPKAKRPKAERWFSSDGRMHDADGNTVSRVPKGAARKALEHHVTGAIERGEKEPVVAVEPEPQATEYEPELEYNSPTPLVSAWAKANTTATRHEIIGPNPPTEGWVWLGYPGKPSDEERKQLKANGFRWHSKRKRWYHRCGIYSKTRGKHNPKDVYAHATILGEDD